MCIFFGGGALILVGNSRFSEGSTIHIPHQRCSPISEAKTLSERASEIFVHSGAAFFFQESGVKVIQVLLSVSPICQVIIR